MLWPWSLLHRGRAWGIFSSEVIFRDCYVDHLSISPFPLSFPSLLPTSLSSSPLFFLPPSLLSFLPVSWIRKIFLKAEYYCSLQCCEYFMNCPSLIPESPSVASPLPWFTASSYTLFFSVLCFCRIPLCAEPSAAVAFQRPCIPFCFLDAFTLLVHFLKNYLFLWDFLGYFFRKKTSEILILSPLFYWMILKVFVTTLPSSGTFMFILQPWNFT